MSKSVSIPISIRAMSTDDLEEVCAIERAAYSIPWSEGNFRDCLLSAKDECFVIVRQGAICGHTIVSNILDETHLLNICVAPDLAGNGIGRQVLQWLIEKAVARKSNVFFLEVRASNRSAISLYQSEGFNEVGVRPNYYPAVAGREDAVLMTLELSIDQYV